MRIQLISTKPFLRHKQLRTIISTEFTEQQIVVTISYITDPWRLGIPHFIQHVQLGNIPHFTQHIQLDSRLQRPLGTRERSCKSRNLCGHWYLVYATRIIMTRIELDSFIKIWPIRLSRVVDSSCHTIFFKLCKRICLNLNFKWRPINLI